MPSEEVAAVGSVMGDAETHASARGSPRAAAKAAPRRLVVVSNRVGPIGRDKAAQGGLAVALRAALERAGGLWFGYSGSISERPSETPKLTIDRNITAAVVDLSRRDFDEYYIGYANRVLWPLFHYRPSLVGFSRRALAGYLRVNRSFARTLAPMLLPEDVVWVHDYHLIPLGEALRQLDCRQPIGFFLHTPFPAAELLRILPNHRELAAALCSYDLVGFQTAADLESFRDYLLRQGGGEDLGGGKLRAFGWTPLRYLNKSFNHRILSGFYRAAQIGLVTPFRDGMNLVAKEYVAAQRPENPGALVLSCFAGAARELAEAIIVNPYDLEAMAEAICQGLQMPIEERRERWAAMMATLRRNDINAWRESFIKALTAAGSGR